MSLGLAAELPKASEHPIPGLLGLWVAEDRLTEGLVLSVGPEDGVVGKGLFPSSGAWHPPGWAHVLPMCLGDATWAVGGAAGRERCRG